MFIIFLLLTHKTETLICNLKASRFWQQIKPKVLETHDFLVLYQAKKTKQVPFSSVFTHFVYLGLWVQALINRHAMESF